MNISRHFNPSDFNGIFYYDLCLTLHYYDLKITDIETFRANSTKYTDFQDWINEIIKSKGYKMIQYLEPSLYNTDLIKHKYGW
jgi:hypothetical protein